MLVPLQPFKKGPEMQGDFSTAANLLYSPINPGLSSTLCITPLPWSKGLSKTRNESESSKAWEQKLASLHK